MKNIQLRSRAPSSPLIKVFDAKTGKMLRLELDTQVLVKTNSQRYYRNVAVVIGYRVKNHLHINGEAKKHGIQRQDIDIKNLGRLPVRRCHVRG